MRVALLVPPEPISPPDGSALPLHWSPGSLPSCLNAEWRRLVGDAGNAAVLAGWGATWPALAGFCSVEQIRLRIARGGLAERDGVLLALLALSHDGDRLAGRVVLQAMLPKAVRVATSVVRRPDVLGDRDEAQARAVAALWQAIATYPLAARPGRVAANLALDTLALVQRGHTGSSHFARTFPEQPFADLRAVGEAGRRDVEPDELVGPVDAQLLIVLAWAVRSNVLDLAEARLLARVYAADPAPGGGAAIAAELDLEWAALRQRCHRLARRVGRAAIAAGLGSDAADRCDGAVLSAA